MLWRRAMLLQANCKRSTTETALEKGKVLKSTGSWYDVKTDGGERLPCRLRGKLRLKDHKETNPVAVGDRVHIERAEDGNGQILDVEQRSNELTREAISKKALEHVIAANIDQALIVQSFRKPQYKPGFIERCLAACELHDIQAVVVMNKLDLARKKDRTGFAPLRDYYQKLGYTVLFTSIEQEQIIHPLRELLRGRITAMVGHSGTGKSSLINAVEPSFERPVGEISRYSEKGKHKTTFAELLELPGGGYILDTPGIKEFGLVGIEPHLLDTLYPDLRPLLEQCHFHNCTHTHEPGCKVKQEWEAGTIPDFRYQHYCDILDTLQDGGKRR